MNEKRKRALLVIDAQLDYFPGYKFPLWNTECVLNSIVNAVDKAVAAKMPVILVQHAVEPGAVIAPFFNAGTIGAELHPRVREAAPNAPVVCKSFADAFFKTELEKQLSVLNVTELLICGMMTQNCVTHTAISRAAEKYNVSVLMDCCTTVSEMLHAIALHALSIRVPLVSSHDAFK